MAKPLRNPVLVAEEIVGSMLPVRGQDQRHKLETFTRLRELRKFIADHPGCTKPEIPEPLGSYLSLALEKRLITAHGVMSLKRRYYVKFL